MGRHTLAWLAAILIGLALSACGSVDKVINVDTPVPPLHDRLNDYERSLRAEADWLWENANFLETRGSPSADQCAAREFNHQPVSMTADERSEDDLSAKIADQLDYAAILISQGRDQWNNFCQLKATGSDTRVFLMARLSPAYQALNISRDALDQREESWRRLTPVPTPTPTPG